MGGIRGLLMMTCGQQQNCKMNYIDISSHSQAIRFHQYILELVYSSFDPCIHIITNLVQSHTEENSV